MLRCSRLYILEGEESQQEGHTVRLHSRRCKRATLAWPPGQANTGGTPVRDGKVTQIFHDGS
jgi:hypothetical protein